MRSVWPVPGTWVGASRRTDTEHHDSVCYDILEGGGEGGGHNLACGLVLAAGPTRSILVAPSGCCSKALNDFITWSIVKITCCT